MLTLNLQILKARYSFFKTKIFSDPRSLVRYVYQEYLLSEESFSRKSEVSSSRVKILLRDREFALLLPGNQNYKQIRK